MSKRAYDVTRSYFDMARASTDTSLVISADAAKDEKLTNNANLGLVSSSWIYSHMAIAAFASAHLHDIWCWEKSGIRIIWLVCERERWPTNSTHNGLAG